MRLQALWNEFLMMAREEVGSHIVETWFAAMNLRAWDPQAKVVHIQAPNPFVKEWVSSKYQSLFERSFTRLLHEAQLIIRFIIVADVVHTPSIEAAESMEIVPAMRIPTRTTRPRLEQQQDTSALHLNYLFDNFVVGSHNSLAYAAAQAIVDKLGTLYNPFFMYGGSGLGKTHLLHAIGNAVRKKSPQLRIIYQSANRFVSDFITAIRFDRIYQFEAQYKNVHLLLIDDIQFLANKEQTQEAFFHLFNVLHQAHRQIVCTSDSLPDDIAGLAERVRSRLVSGLVTDISEPAIETKIAIVRRKAEAQGHCLTDDVSEFIVTMPGAGVRHLEGALIRVFAYASLHAQPITLAVARAALLKQEDAIVPKIDLSAILRCVAKHFEYSVEMLRSKNRHQEIALARHVAMFLMKKLTKHSLREISTFLHRNDHAIVLHAVEKIQNIQKQNTEWARTLELLEQQLHTPIRH